MLKSERLSPDLWAGAPVTAKMSWFLMLDPSCQKQREEECMISCAEASPPDATFWTHLAAKASPAR